MTANEIKISAIENRINVLRARGSACGAIIRKLERKKRVLQAKN